LAIGGTATAAMLVSGEAVVKAAVPGSGAPAYLRRSPYAGLSSPDFALTRGTTRAALRLEGISDLQGAAGSDDAFSLAFSGPPNVEQGISTLRHPELGNFELFLAPVDRSDQRQTYEAVINRSMGVPRQPPGPQPQGDKPPEAPRVRRALLRRVSARRTNKGVSCTVVLDPASNVEQVVAWLMRRDRVLAASSHRVGARSRLTLRLRTHRRLRARRYAVVVIATDADGQMSAARVRVSKR
jgi:hypothetical protein